MPVVHAGALGAWTAGSGPAMTILLAANRTRSFRHLLWPPSHLSQLPLARQRCRLCKSRLVAREARQRRLLVHDGNGAVEPQILGYTGKTSRLKNCLEAAVAAQQGGGAD